MSNENIDQDALATEEMLKMFEGVEPNEFAEEDNVEETISAGEDIESLLAAAEAELLDTDEELSLSDAMIDELEVLDTDDITDIDLDTGDLIDANMSTLADDESEVADDVSIPVIADATDDLALDTDEALTELAEDANLDMASENEAAEVALPAEADVVSTETTDEPITEHLQAVVSNAIQALQDWLTLRDESESKGPEQSIAQLDALLATVTTQQQQLADQLSNSQQQHINELCEQLGVGMVTAESLGWQANEWQQKAKTVADRTQDIQRMNEQIRKELSQL